MQDRGRMRTTRRTLRLLLVAPALIGLVAGSPGCMTRSDRPVVGADSTLVYTSKLPTDVNASILFQLKDSAAREEAKRADKDRGREVSRLKKERERLLKLEQKREKRRQVEEKRKAAAEKKAKKAKKGKKGKKAEEAKQAAAIEAAKEAAAKETAATDAAPDGEADADASTVLSAAALRDSLSAIEVHLRELAVLDSLSDLAAWKQKRPDGAPADDRAVEMEEGARVQANIKLENVYARGKRPMTFHFVWLNADKKKIFKRMLEYTPNDSLQVLTSSLTISPSKRAPGVYTLQVFLFRELIAEKLLELRGTGHEEKEAGEDETM